MRCGTRAARGAAPPELSMLRPTGDGLRSGCTAPHPACLTPGAGLMGTNMKEKVPADKCSWYTVRSTAAKCHAHIAIPQWEPCMACRRHASAALLPAFRGLVCMRLMRCACAPEHAHARCCRPARCPRQGPALFELLDSIESQGRDSFAPFRMPIMDKYR